MPSDGSSASDAAPLGGAGIRRNNLGLVLQDQGDLTGARTQHERALQISEAALGYVAIIAAVSVGAA